MLGAPATLNKRWLVAILLLALAARLGLFHAAPRAAVFLTDDSNGYWELSRSMDRFGYLRWRYEPEIFRTPGYPVFLRGAQSLEGLTQSFQSVANEDRMIDLAVLLQIVLDVALVGLTCCLGARIACPKAGLVAGFLQAISPLAIGASCRILSDSLYAFAFTIAVLLMVAHLQTGRWRTLIASAIVLGAACYVRPVAQLMAPLFAIAAALSCRGHLARAWRGRLALADSRTGPVSAAGIPMNIGTVRAGKIPTYVGTTRSDAPPDAEPPGEHLPWPRRLLSRLAPACMFLFLFAGCIAPWIVRNVRQADYWGFSSVFGDTLFQFAVPDTLRTTHLFIDPNDPRAHHAESFNRLNLASIERGGFSFERGETPGDKARDRQELAIRVILTHLWAYAKLHAKGCLAFWLPSTDVLEVANMIVGGRGTLGVLHREGLWPAVNHYFGGSWFPIVLAVPIALFTLVQYLAAALGLWRGGRRTHWRIPREVTLLLLLVLFSCLVSGTTGVPRFRVPVEPILNVAAAAGILCLKRRSPGEGEA
jgi:hypothetical protein